MLRQAETLQALEADVAAELAVFHGKAVQSFVGAFLRVSEIFAESGHAEHPSAAGKNAFPVSAGASLKDLDVVQFFGAADAGNPLLSNFL